MSSHAWLDSLSEDWPSQPASPEESKPPTRNGTTTSSVRAGGTKMTRPSSGHGAHGRLSGSPKWNSSIVLGERSPSDNNIHLQQSRRTSSKVSRGAMHSHRGRTASQSFPESPAGSVVHNTVQRQSLSSSPDKNKGNTPEWRRRLIYGDVAYGEQRDLFTSAGTGLAGMFRPPTPPKSTHARTDDGSSIYRNESTMPSSPPVFAQGDLSYEVYANQSTEQHLPEHTQPIQSKGHSIQYRLADEGGSDISRISDISVSQMVPQDSVAEDKSSRAPGSFLAPAVEHAGSRKISNQSAACHEEFSPILIAKENDEDGKVKYAPMNISPSELQQRLEKLQRDQASSDGSANDTSRLEGDSCSTEATGQVKQLGSFVNLRRGGPLSDVSFRPLGNTSEMLPEESLQASTPKQFPSLRIHEVDPPRTPSMPAAPFPSPDKKTPHRTPHAQGSSGSPLKLFGPYDTFTNQTLLRRISQFEDANTSAGSSPSPRPKPSGPTSKHPAAVKPKEPSRLRETTQQDLNSYQSPFRSVSQFGVGELDGYEFDEDFSRLSNESEDESLHRPTTFDVPKESSPEANDSLSIGKRRPKSAMLSAMQLGTLSGVVASRAASAAMLFMTPKQQEAHDKRPRASPSKDPTPKRRRTLHESDISFGGEDEQLLEPIQVSHQQMQLVIGRKRKDSHAGDMQQIANAKAQLSRRNLRQRSPTPSQRSSIHTEKHLRSNENVSEGEGAKRSALMPRKAQHLPNLPAGGGRKPSIRTEDFINEAHRIMAAIRGKSGLQSGLASVEESEAEHNKQAPDDRKDSSFQESTREPFSRPPSREGKPIPRVANRQEDPELVSHLKKYEEHSDMGDIIASSLRSLGVSKEDIRAVQALEQHSHSSISEEIEESAWRKSETVSDPPNIRIVETPYRYEHTTAAEQAQQFRDRMPSNNSSSSESGFSTGRSIRTGSSRGSDTRRTIAPQSVSHLIPDQVGNMVLDRQRNVWVKSKKYHATRTKRSNTLHSENSEDDPFADIPDLTVDFTKELQDLENRRARQAAAGVQSPSPRPRGQLHPDQGNSLKSILVKDVAARGFKNGSVRSPSKLIKKFAEADNEDVEHEITMYEDRLEDSSPRRRMTISFSSPIASIIQDVVAASSSEGKDVSVAEQSLADVPPPSGRHGRRTASMQSANGHVGPRPRSSSGMPSRRMSVKGESFVPRPVSIIEEKEEESLMGRGEVSKELSIIGDQSITEHKSTQHRQASVSFMVTTPGRPKSHPQPENTDAIGQYVGNMSLSPLSDFTAHPDRSYAFEVSYVVGDQNLVTGDGTKKRLSQSVRHLVDRLAEVEPSEPYWEDMKDLELRNKQLGSLHMLNRFCGCLTKIDVSHNSIRALDGVPTTVRELMISHNLLSELTAWDRLANLQYVDVSNNHIKSLSAFSGLVHLRGLVADNCGLVNLDGVKYHDSLLTLRARDNSIEGLDFDGSSLQRLTSLDVEGNKIRSVDNLYELSSLAYLNLKGNQLVNFGCEQSLHLKHLIISDNKLRKLDVSTMPRLHLLYADRNKLTLVDGLSRVPHLDNLSLREQGGSKPLDMSFLESAYEVRKLFLSGNRIEFFTPPRDYLNLQLLDLANCGLQRLPDDLGEMMPNLRVLNLNFNGLPDVSGIIGIPRLKRLLLAGNRLADTKPLLKVLGQFPWLVEVDLRDNLITQGFYPPFHMIRREELAEPGDIFRLPDADPARDARFRGRLDMDTRIDRRVYERKFVRACKQIQKLDGLPVNRKIRHLKDTVWKTMVLRGMLLKPDGQPFDLSQYEIEDEEGGTSYMSDGEGDGKSKLKSIDESARWGAEDSFAG